MSYLLFLFQHSELAIAVGSILTWGRQTSHGMTAV
jgi:hypothetical protein